MRAMLYPDISWRVVRTSTHLAAWRVVRTSTHLAAL